ncbi:hypothetical protein [Streptomyces sp. NPDC008139]|uniref:hypothetical protein n=1 Tax=Streptomyces sp. NPDC008139 TaxID=3364814 RepID=UPI0036EF51E0
MTAADENGSSLAYFSPFFEAVEERVGDGFVIPLPDPAPGSVQARDEAPLGPWRGSTLIRQSYNAGVSHGQALCRMISVAAHVDPNSPWTLLRGCLENFTTASWLMAGTLDERRSRTLGLWAEDMRNRGMHEDTGKLPRPVPPGKSGYERRAEIQQLAQRLGLPKIPKPTTNETVKAGARGADIDPDQALAAWQVASGFAHGRYWPVMRASEPRAARHMEGGYMVAFVIDDQQIEPVATLCLNLLNQVVDRYIDRCLGPDAVHDGRRTAGS